MKGPKGALGCRMCKPSGDIRATMPVQLVDTTLPENISSKKIKVEFEVREDIAVEEGSIGEGEDGESVISVPDSRLIVWEIKRPLLSRLPDMTGDSNYECDKRGWFITQLSKAMRYQVYKFAWPPPSRMERDMVSLTDPKRDGNCLFATFIDYIAASKVQGTSDRENTVSSLRGEVMDSLLRNRNKSKSEGSLTWEELAMIQADEINNRREDFGIETLEDYTIQMRSSVENECLWGDMLEIMIMAELFQLNVAVYCAEDESHLQLKEKIETNASRPTIYILHTDSGTHYNGIWPHNGDRTSNNMNELDEDDAINIGCNDENGGYVNELVQDLRGMKDEDLAELYNNVSEAIVERNGYVTDFNVLMAALMGCNTNSLFLGSKEQSKGALFYIGPYICKNLVEVIDSFDLLLEAQEHARKYPSTAEDSTTKKRFVQYVITRVLNKLNSLIEVSDTQAAAALLGMNAGVCSDIFTSYDSKAYEHYVLSESAVLNHENNDDNDSTMFDEESDAGSLNSFIEEDESDTMSDSSYDSRLSFNNERTEHDNEDEGMVRMGDQIEDSSSTKAHMDSEPTANCPFELDSPAQSRYQSTPIYKVDGGKTLIPVPYPKFYRYRGEELRNLSRFEYCTQVKVELKSADKDKGDGKESGTKRGRKKSKAFEFGDGFELKASHVQRLRLKLCTLKLYSSPPTFPGKPPDRSDEKSWNRWKKRADKFGAFYLLLFRPEEDLYKGGQPNIYSYSWRDFMQFRKSLKSGNHFQKMRYRTMQGYMHGWRTHLRDRAILSNYRGRKRTMWSKEERDIARSKFGKTNVNNRTYYDEDEEGPDLTQFKLNTREELNIMKNVSYGDDMTNTLSAISEGFDESVLMPVMDTGVNSAANDSNIESEYRWEECRLRTTTPHHRLADEIMEHALFDEADDNHGNSEIDMTDEEDTNSLGGNESEEHFDQGEDQDSGADELRRYCIEQQMKSKVDAYIEESGLSDDKMTAVSTMRTHFEEMYKGVTEDYTAPVLIITGGPGVGKSYLVDVFDGVSKIMGVGEQLRMALFGIAAVNINGASLCSMMDIPIIMKNEADSRVKEWNADKLEAFKKRYNVEKISAIIIDEISTVKPYMLGYLNARLQKACGSDKPFGGKAIVLLGDFDQLPPAGGFSIPEFAMLVEKHRCNGESGDSIIHNKKKYEVTTVIRQGVEQFTKAKLINLTTQHRSEDLEHTRLLEKMSNGHQIGVDDLRNYKTLSSKDKAFEFATILTPGNRERHEYNNIQSIRWAKKYKTNVLRWQKRTKENTWKGKPVTPANEARAKQESCFWEIFVPGALAYITFNLNMMKGIANGVPVKYHSVSFDSEEKRKIFDELVREAEPGETITLPEPPDIINVEMFPDFEGDNEKTRAQNEKRRKEWKHGSITDEGRIIIPITISQKKYVKWKNSEIRGGGGYKFRPSKVELADYFPIEPGFSVTLHKAQVCTATILSLSQYSYL